MSINVILTEKEVLDTPNDAMLGSLVRNKFWQTRRDQEGPQYDDEHFGLTIGEDGLVTSINRPDEYDTCVICGKETPYLRSTHIDLREGYVEGGGQGCYQTNICEK
jgi:hypothetical protein